MPDSMAGLESLSVTRITPHRWDGIPWVKRRTILCLSCYNECERQRTDDDTIWRAALHEFGNARQTSAGLISVVRDRLRDDDDMIENREFLSMANRATLNAIALLEKLTTTVLFERSPALSQECLSHRELLTDLVDAAIRSLSKTRVWKNEGKTLEDRGIVIDTSCLPANLRVMTMRIHAIEVLRNLLLHTIRLVPDGSTVIVRWYYDGQGQARFEISGPSDYPFEEGHFHLFQQIRWPSIFHHASPAHPLDCSENREDLGLHLPQASQLLRILGGSLTYRNDQGHPTLIGRLPLAMNE